MIEREKNVFLKRPLHKSCFTSLRKKCYKYFCTSCKIIYSGFFEKTFLNLIGENDVDNEILEKTFLDFCVDVDAKDQDVFMIFAEVCIVMCEKTIIILVLDLKILIFGMRNYLEYLFRLCKFHLIKT